MLQHEFTRKMLLLIILLAIVLGIFFVQHNVIISKSTPKPSPTPIAAASGNITVMTPFSGANVSPDFVIQGKARVPGNVISLRITNNVLGKTYFQGQAVARELDTQGFGSYSIQAHLNTDDFSLRPGDKLTLEVYLYSIKDDTESDLVTIPLIFSPQLP